MTQVAAPVACCPKCGSIDVHHKGHGSHGEMVTFWECLKCGRYKGANPKIGRGSVLR